MESKTTNPDIEIKVGEEGMRALHNVLQRQLGRYKGAIMSQAVNAPDFHKQDLENRASVLADLAEDIEHPSHDDLSQPIIKHNSSDPELLRAELTRLYVEFGPEGRAEARKLVKNTSLEQIARRLAGYGQRA